MSKFSHEDEQHLRRALQLAARGQGYVEPNPMVGCVIASHGRVIGEGYHHRFGGPHAEVDALRRCTATPRGATVYVTLEPCCHYGKTPPCTEALIGAEVARVVAPLEDPNPAVAGGGFARLRKAGIRTDVGLLREEVARLNAPFFKLVQRHRPWVILKWAQSLDGKIATRMGESKWITDEVCRAHAHRTRGRVDAIVEGIGSVLRDDFRPDSDVDVLVSFEPEARIGFITLSRMQRELSEIFQRSVDLVPMDGLKPIIRESVLLSSQDVYAA